MAAPKGQPDTIQVQIAFGNNPFDASYTWTDVTQWCRSFRTKRGRQHELNRVEAGTFSGLFDNRDGRFHPWNTSSPYAGLLLVMVPLRVNAIYSAVTYNVWQGFVTAYRGVWTDTANTDMTIEATDGFRALDLLTLQSPYHYEILADAPSEWYRLQETSGSVAFDSSGNYRSGTYAAVNVTYGVTSPVAGGDSKAVTLAGAVAVQSSGTISIPTIALPGAFSAEAWINTAASGLDYAFLQGVMPNQAGNTLHYWLLEASPTNAAFIVQDTAFGGVFAKAQSSVVINDSKWHHIVGTRDGSGNLTIYVDGVSSGTATGGSLAFDSTALMVIGSDLSVTGHFPGSVAEPAVYAGVALSGARVAAHYNAGNGRVNDLTGARINWVLDKSGWPAGLRNIDPGDDSLIAASSPVGALSHILDVTLSENGLTFVAGNGNLTFYERDHVLKPPFTTSQATFGDGGNLPFLLAQTELALDDLDIYNAAAVTPANGATVFASDATSETQYVTRTISPNLLTANPLVAVSAAQWLVNHFKQPYERVRAIVVDALSNPALMWPQMLGRELWDRITVSRTFFPTVPGGTVLAFSQPYLIEGIEHEWTPGYWRTTYRLSPAETQLYLVLNDAVLGKLDSANELAY